MKTTSAAASILTLGAMIGACGSEKADSADLRDGRPPYASFIGDSDNSSPLTTGTGTGIGTGTGSGTGSSGSGTGSSGTGSGTVGETGPPSETGRDTSVGTLFVDTTTHDTGLPIFRDTGRDTSLGTEPIDTALPDTGWLGYPHTGSVP